MRRFLTFELLIHLSDRDLTKVIEEVDRYTVMNAYCDTDKETLDRVKRVFTDYGVDSFEKDVKKSSPISEEIQSQAKEKLAEIADRFLTEGDFDDLKLRKA